MQNAFDMDSFDTEILRKQGNISTQITAFIQRICQSCCNKAISRGGKRQRDLLSDMFAQRYAACRYLINVVAAARTISLPGRGVPLSSQVDMRVIAATGIIWKDIFKRAIECWREILRIIDGTCLEPVFIGRRIRRGIIAFVLRLCVCKIIIRCLYSVQQRILFNFKIDELVQLDMRHL